MVNYSETSGTKDPPTKSYPVFPASLSSYFEAHPLSPQQALFLGFAQVVAELVERQTTGYLNAPGRVAAELCVKMARAIDKRQEVPFASTVFPDERLFLIWLAATLCNVGYLSIPHDLVGVPGTDPGRRDALRLHPTATVAILKSIPLPPEWTIILEWIAAHHELPDGSGFPETLLGDRIPLESRILLLANLYAHLTGHRAHFKALSRVEALDMIRKEVGRDALNEALMEVLVEVLPSEDLWI